MQISKIITEKSNGLEEEYILSLTEYEMKTVVRSLQNTVGWVMLSKTDNSLTQELSVQSQEFLKQTLSLRTQRK